MFNPFALDGQHFLFLYAALLVAAWIFSQASAAWARPEGRDQRVSDADSLAMLNGGVTRLAETAIARLMAGKALQHVAGDRFAPGSARGPVASTLDRGMLSLPMPARWRDLARVAGPEADRLSRQLEQLGLYVDAEEAARLRILQVMPFAALLVLGALRLAQGIGHGRPVGFLVALMALTLIILVVRLAVDRRTRAGIRAVKLARVDHHRLRLAPLHDEMGVAVALFGTAVLAGSLLEPLHRLRAPQGDGGSSDSSGCSSGGCGGGGCGGCGS